MSEPSPSSKVTSALWTVLAVAVAGRVAWELLAPALPLLIIGLGLVVILRHLLGHRRW